MLVFTRRVAEGFWIGDSIFVKVLVIGQRRVKLGIEAPADQHIARSEVRGAPAIGKAKSSTFAPPDERPDSGEDAVSTSPADQPMSL